MNLDHCPKCGDGTMISFPECDEGHSRCCNNCDYGEKIEEVMKKAAIYDDMQLPFSQRVYIPHLENLLKETQDLLAGEKLLSKKRQEDGIKMLMFIYKLREDFIIPNEYPPLTKWFEENRID